MEALGTWLDEKSRSEASVFTGSPRVMLCIFAKKALLCDPKIRVKKRIRAFYASCVSSVLHGAGERAYTQSMMQALRIWELGKLRCVLCLRRRPGESWVMKRTEPMLLGSCRSVTSRAPSP